ncbi:hypothetical protein [Brevibacillus choshinensis]|uniref:hypothetical protein n=1 Tax=Brevibacillus choshinensis TaxID=54911 RepID=UPI002E1D1C3C|nr:hypothetical protein [Brevibacillus choshinensis]
MFHRLSPGELHLGDSMIENFELYEKALNKEAEGAAVLKAFHKNIDEAKTKRRQSSGTKPRCKYHWLVSSLAK